MFGRFIKPPTTPRQAPKPVLGKKGTTPSVLGADMHILGNLVGDGIIDIDGQVDGNVRCHTASIRINGCVRGDIVAEIVHVYGAVEGVIRGKTVMLYSTAKVVGTIMHEALTIEDGAFVDGKFKRTDKVFIESDTILKLPSRNTMEEMGFSGEFDDELPATDEELRVLETLRLVR